MPVAALIDAPPSADNQYHADQMLARFAASSPGAGWTASLYPSATGFPDAVLAALADGRKVLFSDEGVHLFAAHRQAIADAGAVLVASIGTNSPISLPGDPRWPIVAVTPGTALAGNAYTGYGRATLACIECHDLAVGAQSWAVASAAAVLTRYPEAATDPEAAAVRMIAGAVPIPGAARWTEREGFGVVRTFLRDLVGSPVGTVTPGAVSAPYDGAPGTITAITGGHRFTLTSAHAYLVAFRDIPAVAPGQGIRYTFDVTNHHATAPVRIRSRNGGASVTVEAGESVGVEMDAYVNGLGGGTDMLFIETTQGVGGQVDASVTNVVATVYAQGGWIPLLSPASGALSPILTAAPVPGTVGKVAASWVPLGGVATSVRVDGSEHLRTTATAGAVYVAAGTASVDVRAVLPSGALTEAHALAAATVDGGAGYVPPAPTVEALRIGGEIVVTATAEGASSYTVTAQSGSETPTPVVGAVAWAAHLPARIAATATAPGGTSPVAVAYVPTVADAVTLVEAGLHPRVLP